MDAKVYLDYKGFNANQTSWRRILEYYDSHAEDRSRIFYTFPSSKMTILIIVHKRIPLKEFRSLLYGFFHIKATEDQIKNDDVEIRVTKRGSGNAEERSDDTKDEEPLAIETD